MFTRFSSARYSEIGSWRSHPQGQAILQRVAPYLDRRYRRSKVALDDTRLGSPIELEPYCDACPAMYDVCGLRNAYSGSHSIGIYLGQVEPIFPHHTTICNPIYGYSISLNASKRLFVMKPTTYQFLVGSFAALGSFLFGYDLAVIAGVVAADSFSDSFLQQDADARSGTVVALFTAGCFVGAGLSPFTGPLGRRGTILLACCVFVVGGAVQTSAVVIGMLYTGRFIAGMGVGFLVM